MDTGAGYCCAASCCACGGVSGEGKDRLRRLSVEIERRDRVPAELVVMVVVVVVVVLA